MTREQAVQMLHQRLPREASFQLCYIQSVHSEIHLDREQTNPALSGERADWTVAIFEDDYCKFTMHNDLADAVRMALEHYAARQLKPSKARAPSSVGAQSREVENAG